MSFKKIYGKFPLSKLWKFAKRKKIYWNEYFFKEHHFSEFWQRKKFWKYLFVYIRLLATVYEILERILGIVCEKTRREIFVFHCENLVLILRIFAAKPLQKFTKFVFCSLDLGNIPSNYEPIWSIFHRERIFLLRNVFLRIP